MSKIYGKRSFQTFRERQAIPNGNGSRKKVRKELENNKTKVSYDENSNIVTITKGKVTKKYKTTITFNFSALAGALLTAASPLEGWYEIALIFLFGWNCLDIRTEEVK